jgi:hypothetical protein
VGDKEVMVKKQHRPKLSDRPLSEQWGILAQAYAKEAPEEPNEVNFNRHYKQAQDFAKEHQYEKAIDSIINAAMSAVTDLHKTLVLYRMAQYHFLSNNIPCAKAIIDEIKDNTDPDINRLRAMIMKKVSK